MKTLPTVIGPAPSELSLEDFLQKLEKERERVKQGLNSYWDKQRVKRTKSTPKPKGKKLSTVSFGEKLLDLNLSKDELKRRLEKLANDN